MAEEPPTEVSEDTIHQPMAPYGDERPEVLNVVAKQQLQRDQVPNEGPLQADLTRQDALLRVTLNLDETASVTSAVG